MNSKAVLAQKAKEEIKRLFHELNHCAGIHPITATIALARSYHITSPTHSASEIRIPSPNPVVPFHSIVHSSSCLCKEIFRFIILVKGRYLQIRYAFSARLQLYLYLAFKTVRWGSSMGHFSVILPHSVALTHSFPPNSSLANPSSSLRLPLRFPFPIPRSKEKVREVFVKSR